MNYMMIENKGSLSVEALILLGASTKRGDSTKIGFFGSGNKYAIPTFIRLGIPFKIFSGEKEITIETVDVEFRGKIFKRIIIGGEHTSLTTDMGPQWEEWMALREWVSNSLDEEESKIVKSTDVVEGIEGYTRFYIEHTKEIVNILDNWDTLFTFDRKDAIYESDTGTVYGHLNKDEHIVLFRKGIRVHNSTSQKSIFQYDIPIFSINESRVVESVYSAGFTVARFLSKVSNVKVIKKLLSNLCNGTNDYWEKSLEWKYANIQELSDAWREAIEDRVLIIDVVKEYYQDIIKTKKHYIINTSMAYMLNSVYKDEIKIHGLTDDGDVVAYKTVDRTPKIEALLSDSVRFLSETSYSVDYPIEVVKFERDSMLGLAQDSKILLSEKVFSLGRKEIVSTIIEENEHLKTGLRDCTRGFQNHFINMFICEKEERFNKYL